MTGLTGVGTAHVHVCGVGNAHGHGEVLAACCKVVKAEGGAAWCVRVCERSQRQLHPALQTPLIQALLLVQHVSSCAAAASAARRACSLPPPLPAWGCLQGGTVSTHPHLESHRLLFLLCLHSLLQLQLVQPLRKQLVLLSVWSCCLTWSVP